MSHHTRRMIRRTRVDRIACIVERVGWSLVALMLVAMAFISFTGWTWETF